VVLSEGLERREPDSRRPVFGPVAAGPDRQCAIESFDEVGAGRAEVERPVVRSRLRSMSMTSPADDVLGEDPLEQVLRRAGLQVNGLGMLPDGVGRPLDSVKPVHSGEALMRLRSTRRLHCRVVRESWYSH